MELPVFANRDTMDDSVSLTQVALLDTAKMGEPVATLQLDLQSVFVHLDGRVNNVKPHCLPTDVVVF